MRTLLIAALAMLPATAQVAPDEVARLLGQAKEARVAGDLAAASDALKSALALAPDPTPELAAIYSDLAAVQRALTLPDDAIESLSRAVNIRARGKVDPVPQARDLTSLALLYLDAERDEEAKSCLVQALAEWDNAGRDGPEILVALESLAALHRGTAEYDQAEPLYVRALRIREFAYGPQSSELLGALDSLAYVHFGQKRYSDAEPLYTRLLAIWERSAGPEHPMIALTLEKFAEFLSAQNRYAEASPLVEKAMGIRARAHIASMNYGARLLLMQSRLEEAGDLLRRTIATAESAGLGDETFAEPMRVYAALLRQQGRTTEAQKYADRFKAVIMKGEARPLPKPKPRRD